MKTQTFLLLIVALFAVNHVEVVAQVSSQASQKQAFEHREDGGVDADAECERQHGDGRHQRPARERTQRVPEVLKHETVSWSG